MSATFVTCSVNPCEVAIELSATSAISALRSETAAVLQDPSLIGLTPEAIAAAYGWGFGAVLSMFVVGYVLGVALGLIRKT